MQHTAGDPSDDLFPIETAGLPGALTPTAVRLRNGDRFQLRIAPVLKRIGNAEVRMLAYNGSIPGPALHVDQGSEVTVDVTNHGDIEATVHWHGLRLENRYDGVPHETQVPISVGATFTYRITFPDAGFYWYHPHVREDYGLEMGLYGTILVEPAEPAYWPPADRELTVTLDDVLLEGGRIAPFHKSGPTFTAMGRFGNILLVNGDTGLKGEAKRGEVVRLSLVNTANTRIFNFAVRGARMKLIGGDSGRYERETFVDEVLIAPSERAIVDVLFETEGNVSFEHRTPGHRYDLGVYTVFGVGGSAAQHAFDRLRLDPELTATRESITDYVERRPDKVLAFVSSMPLLYGGDAPAASAYACPMHPEVIESEPGRCPKCGMRLIPSSTSAMVGHQLHQDAIDRAGGDGIEWEDLMPEINRASNPSNMIWKVIDRETGAENGAISWAFDVGDRVKIRLVNEMDSDHPMHHPFHFHGAGRFLILSRDGQPETNLVWKDTVLVRAGQSIDILLDVSNPGRWMAHCHIAEHNQSGMMFSFDVRRRSEPVRL
ncbi:MAG TPA: multicopper oxidase family protein [Candidatus Dormibacteraeota bacterium]|nr:multicopper oxidase family protein [Candidatus Dormibacteraeota bacterium]